MNVQSQAKIIGYNINCGEICASAARISTTQGNANDIFELAQGNPKNPDLIQKVLRSGHKSIIEHAVFTIAFCMYGLAFGGLDVRFSVDGEVLTVREIVKR